MDIWNFLFTTLVINAVPLLLAITLHEAAHGYVARMRGDNTAYRMGRVTLNPIKHVDPVGTLAFPAAGFLLSGGGVLFGWAKPVPVNPANLRKPKGDMFWVAAAGPASNVVQAVVWALVAKAVMVSGPTSIVGDTLFSIAIAGISWNVVIAVLNLFPILPLDGGRIVASLLPNRLSRSYSRLEPYGMPVLIGLIILATFYAPLRRAYNALQGAGSQAFYSIFGLQ